SRQLTLLNRLPDDLLRQSGGKNRTFYSPGFPRRICFYVRIAVRAWRIAASDVALTPERQETLEAKFLRDLQENADGVLVAERGGAIVGWGTSVPQSNYISDLWVDLP